jgi:hypothetical protein
MRASDSGGRQTAKAEEGIAPGCRLYGNSCLKSG